jgi:5'-3' exonuclease
VRVHLVDGTYELFRQYFGRPSRSSAAGNEVGAALGVASSMLAMLADGATHLGVATDHVIESFRNDLWLDYKTGAGTPEELLAQFPLLEEVLESLGIKVWPMVELEADDALASAARVADADPRVEQVIICTPDKDLAQCVRDERVVQLDRRSGRIDGVAGVLERFGVLPESIPDWLALVGDSADGFPGLPGWGKRSASVLLAHYRHLEAVPSAVTDWDRSVVAELKGAAKLAQVLREGAQAAQLFRTLATLRVDESLLRDVDELEWHGPSGGFSALCASLGMPALAERAQALAKTRAL